MDIIWSDELKTGIQIIDEQHQLIIELLSGVRLSKLSKADIFQLLGKLQDYLSTHFEVEENCMIDSDYPEYAFHKANHDEVLANCKNILAKNDSSHSPREVALELINYVQSWFIDHYSSKDTKMADYLKQNNGRIN